MFHSKSSINIMAKSDSFFGLRRGSTKSLTFQVLDGKQVTKDRVAVVKNPKTSRQAEQRAKLLPAIRFMAMFSALVDHSFENVAYGQKSKQHFLSLAMKTQPTNPMLKGQLGWYPQAYTISQGSLATIGAERAGDHTMKVFAFHGGNELTFEQLLAANPRFQEGDQLTAIAVIEGSGGPNGESSYQLVYDRVIVNRENYVNGMFNTQNGLFEFNFDDAAPDGCYCSYVNSDALIVSGAVVQSRRTAKKWLRSTEEMFCDFLGYSDWNASVASYMTAASELTSPWYLNAADNEVVSPADVESGEWSPLMLGPAGTWGTGNTLYLGAKNNLYGNYAVVTTDGTSGGFALSFNGLSSDKTVANVVLSDFTQSQTRGDAVQPAAVSQFTNFGSDAVAALAEGQPDQFLKASVVGK